MYKSILVPIDLAELEKGKTEIDQVKHLAAKGARIRLLNVVADIPAFVAANLPGEVIDTAKADARETLKALAGAAGIKADVEVRTGNPGPAILASADDCEADLIIVRSHKPGLQDYFLGSTAARVVRHAQCSVLVLR